jgi:RNA-binding protein
VGGEGITEAFLGSVTDAFNTRELLKVKVLESAPLDARAAAQEIAGRLGGVEVAQVIGRTVVLYRPSPGERHIRLPD